MVGKLDGFELLDIIGRGTNGLVKKVKRKKDGLIMVGKELHYASMTEDEKQGLVLEVNLLRGLHHPNIVKFYNYVVDHHTGTLFIFMEYCPGGDLKQLISKCIKTGSYFEEKFIWIILKQICEALSMCHDKDINGSSTILHRDIKPANVFLDREGNAKLGDFGLARTLSSEMSYANTFAGTPYYMSPEVINGYDYNEKSDIWSLGCLIYELCALSPPFTASNQRELAIKIQEQQLERIPSHYSKQMWEVISLMLNRNEILRPSTFEILENPALKTNTLSPLESNLEMSLARMSSPLESASDCSSSNTSSLSSTVKENKKTDEEKRLEDSVMREVQEMMLESRKRKEVERLAVEKVSKALEIKDFMNERNNSTTRRHSSASLHSRESISSSKVASTSVNKEDYYATYSKGTKFCSNCVLKSQNLKQKSIEKIPCICEGMTHEEWKSRISFLRSSEASIRARELAVEDRERELNLREKRIYAMEQEVKQHLVRAQLYLKHSKQKKEFPGNHNKTSFEIWHDNVEIRPKTLPNKYDDAVDTTTVSADIGYDIATTTAYLDTEAENNPFLKMREKQAADKPLTTNKIKSNTLDNPKSRKKHNNVFYLDNKTNSSCVQNKPSAMPNKPKLALKNINTNVNQVKKPGNVFSRLKLTQQAKPIIKKTVFTGKENQTETKTKTLKARSSFNTGQSKGLRPKCYNENLNTNENNRPIEIKSNDQIFRLYTAV